MNFLEKHHRTLIVLLLELLSLSPIFMILGNVIPPFPLKVHFITLGLSFILMTLFLIQYHSKKWIAYIAFFYFIIQFTLSGLHIKDFVDFFFGPFVFITLIDILFNDRISNVVLWKYQKRFFALMLIPVIISSLQFLEILPLTFWNASYINYSVVDGVKEPRPNGFLYHGSELSIIIFFIGVKQLVRSQKYFLVLSLIILFIAYGTYYKALTATIILLIVYYYVFIRPLSFFNRAQVFFKYEKRLYGMLLLFAIFSLLTFLYVVKIKGEKEIFDPELLTGRGAIWNVYLQAVKDFSFFEWIFGAGIGAEPILFEKYSTPELFYPLQVNPDSDLTPDGHNAILSTFLNAGVFGVMLYVFLFKIVYSQISRLKNIIRSKAVYFFIFIISVFTIGVTIPFFKNAIYWIALSFTIYFWFISEKNDDFYDH
ncbi:O-antigen polymerase [Salibacter halophilus]|uniref:Oligosaccharide repeat unit polymerase n=1 Tax=Salibacter halophilus TaxID=1803916 RepID=A0A6N6M884_9FLAO|nr:O-antigen polymerase [Salibacter halophilus]KAB1064860.1 oligosaccharide repeat unit polymerase [Salibacter halophilus]